MQKQYLEQGNHKARSFFTLSFWERQNCSDDRGRWSDELQGGCGLLKVRNQVVDADIQVKVREQALAFQCL